MFCMPSRFNYFLRERGLVDQIYAAMKSDDHSQVVMAALDALEKSGTLPLLPKERKSEAKSNEYRNEGNVAFKAGYVNKALEFYNRALMYAPVNSRAMKLAYSNRSAILFHKKHFIACLSDIEACCRLGCPADIASKLSKRKEEATNCSIEENVIAKNWYPFFQEYFDFNREHHTQIPCTTTDVKVVSEGNAFKIVAANDIKVGTVLALEPSFVSCNDVKNALLSCHYCHKMSLNLIPCEGCCFVLFCSEECKQFCLKEYHNIECQIMEIIITTVFSPMAKLMVKGTLKFVQMCGSWREVISASQCTGVERSRVSSVQEIYDVGNKLSVLNFNDNQRFIYGSMYSASFVCATIIYHLEKIPKFLPRAYGERKYAIRALARIMIYFSIYGRPTEVALTVCDRTEKKVYTHSIPNHGWYPFIGKLQNSCIPNLIVINLNKKAALIALQPIKKGSELTVSYISAGQLRIQSEDHL